MRFKYPSDFELFYGECPRREGKLAAFKKWEQVQKSYGVTKDELLNGIRAYAASVADKETQYIKHPATWLNQGCWDDDYTIRRRMNASEMTRAIARDLEDQNGFGDGNSGDRDRRDGSGVQAGERTEDGPGGLPSVPSRLH